jgi:hypothetical protein
MEAAANKQPAMYVMRNYTYYAGSEAAGHGADEHPAAASTPMAFFPPDMG